MACKACWRRLGRHNGKKLDELRRDFQKRGRRYYCKRRNKQEVGVQWVAKRTGEGGMRRFSVPGLGRDNACSSSLEFPARVQLPHAVGNMGSRDLNDSSSFDFEEADRASCCHWTYHIHSRCCENARPHGHVHVPASLSHHPAQMKSAMHTPSSPMSNPSIHVFIIAQTRFLSRRALPILHSYPCSVTRKDFGRGRHYSRLYGVVRAAPAVARENLP